MSIKKLLTTGVASTILITSTGYAQEYQGSRISDLWREVSSDAYTILPQYQVTFFSFFSWARNLLKESAFRTIGSHEDILPKFDKLVHPNGICLIGKWQINQNNPYSGFYRNGSDGTIISRISVAMSATTAGNYRAFGVAGKLFPSANFNYTQPLKSGNFFTVDDLGGTLTEHFTETEVTNEPAITARLSSIGLAPIAAAAGAAFSAVDANPGIRQLYEISEMGETDFTAVKTPKWMKLAAAEGTPIVNEADFRDEIYSHINNYGELVLDISVANSKNSAWQIEWEKIGRITFTNVVASESCDKRLHFHHPAFRFNQQ